MLPDEKPSHRIDAFRAYVEHSANCTLCSLRWSGAPGSERCEEGRRLAAAFDASGKPPGEGEPSDRDGPLRTFLRYFYRS